MPPTKSEVVPTREIIGYRTKAFHTITYAIASHSAPGNVVVDGPSVRPFNESSCWIDRVLSQKGVSEESGVSAHSAARMNWLADQSEALKYRHSIHGGALSRPADFISGEGTHADHGPGQHQQSLV